jgi:hypothetical protein
VSDSDRGYHQIDCECGRTTTAEDRDHATVLHLTHVLNDHEDLADWEEDTAREQLEAAEKEVGQIAE